MAKNNIYDLIISELILRLAEVESNNYAPNIILTHTLPGDNVVENYTGDAVYTSEIVNIPSGYTVLANSHVIQYPGSTPPTESTSTIVVGPLINIIVGLPGSTFEVTSTATLIHASLPDIVLTTTSVISSVGPMYYGVKPFTLNPDITGLTATASTATTFQMSNSTLGRLYIVTSLNANLITSVLDPSGLIYSITNDFTVTIVGTKRFYILNHATKLTGANLKTFTLIY